MTDIVKVTVIIEDSKGRERTALEDVQLQGG